MAAHTVSQANKIRPVNKGSLLARQILPVLQREKEEQADQRVLKKRKKKKNENIFTARKRKKMKHGQKSYSDLSVDGIFSNVVKGISLG